jgi:dipeptidyl aminopeptidase/acylaminoacyl peptidase
MTDLQPFETRFERRLRDLAEPAARPFDAGEIARAAVATAPQRGSTASGWRTVLVVLGAATLLVLGLAGAAVVGSALLRPPPAVPAGILAIATSNGLVLSGGPGNLPQRTIDADGPFFQPAWSPDGTSVAAMAVLPGDANALRVYDEAGDLYGGASNVEAFAWSPDGRYLLVDPVAPLAGPAVVVTHDAPDLGEIPVPETAVGFSGMAWLRDGRIVAGIRVSEDAENESGLWILDPVAHTATRMGGDAGRSGAWPVVSPDGTRIAMLTQRCDASNATCRPRIRIVDAETGGRRAEVEDATGVTSVLWAPDGTGIAFDTSDGSREAITWWSFAGDVRELAGSSGAGVWPIAFTPDGSAVLFHRLSSDAGSTDEVWSVSIDGGDTVLVASDATGVAFQP